jgi:Uma2 family endonuclease
MTAEELLQLGDNGVGELIAGEFISMSPAGGAHGRLASRINRIVGDFVEQHALGETFGAETGFIVAHNPDTVRAPDFAFIAKERLSLIGDFDEFIPIAPDLAVEVVSPYDRWTKIEEKVQDYLRAGTRLVWVLNPKTKTIHVYHGFASVVVLMSKGQLEGGEVLPGFSVAVGHLFA